MERRDPTLGDLSDLDTSAPIRPAQPTPRVDAAETVETVTPAHLNPRGRLTRMRFVVRLGASVFLPLAALVGAIDWAHDGVDARDPTTLSVLGATLATVLAYHLLIAVRRLHDMDTSGWLALFVLVPGLNLSMWFALALIPGTRQANRFGAPNPRNSALIWLGYLLFVIVPIGLAPSAALLYEAYLQAR